MPFPLGSPRRAFAVQSQDEQLERPKQLIGLSELDTGGKAFRYLDFAEGGANAALNKWGQFLQFSRLVTGGGDPSSWNYVSVEPRNIFRLEHIAPAQTSCEKEQGEDDDEEVRERASESERRAQGWEPDNPEWKPSVYYYSDYPAYPRRHDKFNALCMRNRGLGLRFSDNTEMSEPEHYYRNDRWPEICYIVERKVKVVVRHYIQDGEIIQDMCLTSESDEETELNLEFEFTTGVRIAPGNMSQLKEGNVGIPDHFLQRVSEGEAPGSHWKIRHGDYYATASLFKDGEPKPFSLLVDGEQGNKVECRIDILSDETLRHRETFVLKSKASVKFTSIFRLDHESVPVTLPHYFDISPRLESFDGRWWSFRTESSSFIFRRNLETILSHAIPLPRVKDECYQPYVLHDHDLINTFQTWSSSLNQAFYLLEIDKILQQPGTADGETKSHYRKRIRNVIFGYFVWLLRHAERNGFPETILLHWSGKFVLPAKGDENGDVVIEVTKAAEEPPCPRPMSSFEPKLSKYEDKFRNCCQFLVLLDMCSTNYPDEVIMFTRMVNGFLKLAWEPIEMSKHRGSHLWPDRLDILEGFPSSYARFQDWRDYENCGYGGQGIYVYVITTQVLVWRAVKSAKRLLNLVSDDQDWSEWMIGQSLDDKEIRDRTIEAFRCLGTGTSHDYSPDRFFAKIKGHIRESFLDQWSCDIAIPSFVEDFFFDDKNEPMPAWTETLRYYDTFSDCAGTQMPNTWEYFMRYQFTIDRDRREALRENFEARAYAVGLFTNGAVTHSSHCPYTTSWAMVTYALSADHTELLYPKFRVPINMDYNPRANWAQGPMLLQEGIMDAGINPGTTIGVGARQDGRKPGKKGKGVDITAEDRSQVNDPPSYGDWYWFREPLFMKYKAKKFEMNKGYIEKFLKPEDNWGYFWETSKGKDKFLKNMVDTPNYDWGNKNTLVKPYRNGEFGFFQGNEALLKLQEPRDPQMDKKRILVMEDCKIEHLITLMASIDFQEAGHIGEFLSRFRLMDPHEMRFLEQTIMPDNLWITEFNINFITAPFLVDVESPLPPNYFSKKRARIQSINDIEPTRMMAESAMGFRIIGDLHDRYWTCYVFYDFGSEKLVSDARTEVERSDYTRSSSQRKYLEGFLVRQALDLVLSETEAVLRIITKSMGGDKEKTQTLFSPLLTEDDLSGENYFKTMNKNSVFYPWLLEVYGALRDKCTESRNVADLWMSAEKTRKYKPRWSEKDQKGFGEEVAKNRIEVKARCIKLEKTAKNLQERIDRIKTLKESLSSELGLREARTSTQLAHTVNLFAVVTTIYLPLTFSTSIVAIQDFHWPSPAKALIKVTLAVTFGTLILLMNLAFLRRRLATLKTWAQGLIRQRMARVPESKGHSEELVFQEKRPAWKYWNDRARGLREAEKRSTLLTDNAIHENESDWWYWFFMAIFIIIVVPVQELAFIIRTFRLQRIKGAGPLKKLVRVPWAPIWILQLALVYVIILAGYALLFLVGLVHRAAVWLWTGDDIPEREEAAPEVDETSLMSEPEGDEKISCPGSDSMRGDGGLVGWLKKPARTMQLLIVAEALSSKKEKKGEEMDVERQGTAP
ncbi:unnamed protein product [Tuber aestivum]|uniref:Uncharacterized protein n=1 Tax=Tuber aestivum TaxID=59557 RepID=A0A292Q8I2_9PEZI|nr:unnamed protein product [Tuber aestivum]